MVEDSPVGEAEQEPNQEPSSEELEAFEAKENAAAPDYTLVALAQPQARTAARKLRGVEGTSKK